MALDPRACPLLASLILHQACLLAACGIERLARRNPTKTSEPAVLAAHAANSFAALLLPTACVWRATARPGASREEAAAVWGAVWYEPPDHHAGLATVAATNGGNGNGGILGGLLGRGGGGGGGGGVAAAEESTSDLFMNATLPGFFVLFSSVVLFMKLLSYAHVNYDYRLAAREAANVPMDQVCVHMETSWMQ